MQPIKVRKPKTIKFFGFGAAYDRYSNRWYKWSEKLPNNGERIKITWLPKNNREVNAYIGFEGIVEDMDKIEGSFCINSGTSILICNSTNFDYIKL